MAGLAADNLVDGLTRVEEEHNNYHHYGQAQSRWDNCGHIQYPEIVSYLVWYTDKYF